MTSSKHYFICGIGGSGMLPLAVILKGLGHEVSGSDRSNDQVRTPEKFAWIGVQGIRLYPQDGSGISAALDRVVISKAVEDTVPDIAEAKKQSIPIDRRVDLLIELFNQSGMRIAVSGTSGKTTTTGMIGFMLKEAGLDPTVMNGGIFLNYAEQNPYSTAFVGKGDIFVSEVDESDGIDAVVRYNPDIAVIHNVTLDHQPMEELKAMFAGFLAKTETALLNADDPVVLELAGNFSGRKITYSAQGHKADIAAKSIVSRADGITAQVDVYGGVITLKLKVPGRHNVANALAALSCGVALGMEPARCAELLSEFSGIRRRMEIVGSRRGMTVMDDFAHNPDKIAATLGTLREFPGRLHVFFQPHGYGFLKVVGPELGQSFAENLGPEDRLYMVEPFYAGGTVDRSVGSAEIVADINRRGANAILVANREAFKSALLSEVREGDRIIVMGARDDTLSDFAKDIVKSIS